MEVFINIYAHSSSFLCCINVGSLSDRRRNKISSVKVDYAVAVRSIPGIHTPPAVSRSAQQPGRLIEWGPKLLWGSWDGCSNARKHK